MGVMINSHHSQPFLDTDCFFVANTAPTASSVAAYCLLLPGKTLYLSALLAAKKFRNRGNKPAALGAFHELEEAGLGKIDTEERSRGAATVSICASVI